MNKFIILIVAAIAVSSISASQLNNSETDVDQLLAEMEEHDEGVSYGGVDNGLDEVANVPERHLYFRDYCLSAHDTIRNYVSEKLNGATANIYSIMLSTATDIGREVLNAQQSSVVEGTRIIEQAQSENGGQANEDQVEETLMKQGIFQRVTSAVKNVIWAILDTARATLFSRVQELKEQLGSEGLKKKIEDACLSITIELEPRLNRQFSEAKSQIKSASGSDQSVASTVAGSTLSNIGCGLTYKIAKVAMFCDILKVAGPTVYTLVGIE